MLLDVFAPDAINHPGNSNPEPQVPHTSRILSSPIRPFLLERCSSFFANTFTVSLFCFQFCIDYRKFVLTTLQRILYFRLGLSLDVK